MVGSLTDLTGDFHISFLPQDLLQKCQITHSGYVIKETHGVVEGAGTQFFFSGKLNKIIHHTQPMWDHSKLLRTKKLKNTRGGILTFASTLSSSSATFSPTTSLLHTHRHTHLHITWPDSVHSSFVVILRGQCCKILRM